LERPTVVSRQEWLVARKALLEREKEATRERDALSAARRGLPMVEIDKAYGFDGPAGRVQLIDLFGDQPQLIVYHFMFDPSWDEGCKSCSYLADNLAGSLSHLAARDTAFALVSRAPLARIESFKKRMGWDVPWYSSFGSDFNYDFHVTVADDAPAFTYENGVASKPASDVATSEAPGLSVFLRDGDRVFHTYSTYQRGLDGLIGTYNYLDLTPLGRHEDELSWSMEWLRHHDRYTL